VDTSLKTPRATAPDDSVRIWFKPQSASGGKATSMSKASPLLVDLRTVSVPDLVKAAGYDGPMTKMTAPAEPKAEPKTPSKPASKPAKGKPASKPAKGKTPSKPKPEPKAAPAAKPDAGSFMAQLRALQEESDRKAAEFIKSAE